MRASFDTLQREILASLAETGDDFRTLAQEVFRFQWTANRPYRAFCDALGISPASVSAWHEVPAVPAEAFKSAPPLTCLPSDQCALVFQTSGTTAEKRGRHFLADARLYEASVLAGWQHADLPVTLRPLFLAPPPATTPDSSLAAMFGFLARRDADRAPAWLIAEDGTIDPSPLHRAVAEGTPVLLFSTALALRHFFERFPLPVPLPPGSHVFQTGGYKGLRQRYEPRDLYAAVAEHLAVPPARVINEYGMTELSTPSYALGLDTPHRTPPWLRVRTINPESNRSNPPGGIGHLAFFDLANLNSVAAVRTRDLGLVHDDDGRSFTLLGRDAAAPPRGCSRASDSFLQGSA